MTLAVRLGPLALKNPITTASGTFGYGLEFTDFVDLADDRRPLHEGAVAAARTPATRRRASARRPPGCSTRSACRTSASTSSSPRSCPKLRALGATVIANVWGDLEDDYVTVVRALEGAEGIAAVELNISCPNVRQGGMLFGNSPPLTRSLVAKVRAATTRPLIVKLSPNAPDLVESARAAHEAGADILSLVNTFVGMAIDPETARPRISFGTGGLSGPAIRPLAVRMVYQVAQALPGVPLMGIGGIAELSDVLEFLAAGATAVQVGTANFKDPGVSGRLVTELAAYCEAKKHDGRRPGRTRARATGKVGGEAGAEG